MAGNAAEGRVVGCGERGGREEMWIRRYGGPGERGEDGFGGRYMDIRTMMLLLEADVELNRCLCSAVAPLLLRGETNLISLLR